ncbi:MAG TPA: DNA gyrase subunit A [Bryobacteraceae bacterium]|nr:DNA gyrase subunit A [Bryobacteraceae bacterium]
MPDQELPPQGPPSPPSGGNLPLPGTPGGDGNKNHIPINIEEEMRHSYLDYAMSVIVGRALPDVRDGLKPVHRRILYTMQQMGLQPNRPTRKCARVVGDCMGKYHPHGDMAIYDALVRMAQDFSMRYPLVDGQGNFGSVDGDPPAAQRYTECRLSRAATALLEDLDKETVDFKANYDGSEEEPEVLPTRIPNLLVNGSAGIAVGMATNVPPHNLSEIIDAAVQLIREPKTPIAKILELVPGPDFPTGGYILGRAGVVDAYTKGRGQLKIRAKAAIERVGKDKEQIVVTEIPYQVNKSKLLEQIAAMVNEKRIEGIADVQDHSDRDGMRITIELKRGEQAEVVLNNLYKHTQLQIGFGAIMLSIVNGQPRELGLVDLIKCFIDHRVEVVRRRTEYELRKAREREHILLGFQKALENLDEVIKLIRASKAPKEAKDALITRFSFTDRQAQAIIELQLQRLTGMERQKILDELADIQRRIAEYLEILGSEKVLRDLIVQELREVQKEYGDTRRTQIIEDTGEITLADLVAVEDVAITVTRGGYLKRTSVDTYRRQTRGGKGRIGMGTRAEDFVEYLIVASTHAYLLIFTTRGRVYWLKAYEIPDATTIGKGKHINNLINLQPDETVKAFLAVKDFVPERNIIMVTKHGVIKKSELTEFDNPMSRGIIALSLDDGDELIAAKITNGSNYVFLGSHDGQAIRFKEDQVRPMGRPARGVRAMDLAEDDYLVGMEVVEEDGLILSIAENGFGKRTPLHDYRLTNRGGKGVINMKTTNKTGKVVAVLSVKEDSELMIVSQNGKIIRIESSEIRQAGRSTQGVKLVSLEEGDKVAAASVIPETENGNGQENLPIQ